MQRHRNAQAQMVSVALYTAIIVIGVSTVIIVGEPILEDMRDAEAVDAAMNMLTEMEQQILAVADAGEGTTTEIGLRFARGEFIFDSASNSITYELDTTAEMISPHSSRQIGNLRLSSMADVTVEESAVNGQPCWNLENDHISVCIRNIPTNATEQIGGETAGYWRFNENQGSTASDTSPHGNDGSISGAQWTDGVTDHALAFDGVSDHVTVQDDPVLDEDLDELSVSAWVYVEKEDPEEMEVVVRKQRTGTPVYTLARRSAGDIVFYGDGFDFTTSDTVLQDSTWHHVAGTVNSTHVRVYVDGVLEGENTGDYGVTESTEDLFIGGDDVIDAEYLEGRIDEVRIWDHALHADRVGWVYSQQGRLDFIDTEDLILQYYNKDADESLDADFSITLQTNQPVDFTHNGTGYVEPVLTGDNLGRGELEAEVRSFFGIDYTVTFTLRSGSDFLQVDVED